MQNDVLANALSILMNSEMRGKKQVTVRPASKLIREVITLLNKNLFIGESEYEADGKGGKLNVKLLGVINKCGAIKPRFSLRKGEFEKLEKHYLPAKDFGVLIITTQQGVMTHKEAKKKGVGGKLLAYCY